MKLTKKNLRDIIPYENNPRINDDAVESVAESIRQCGYVSPIVIDEDGVILAGHTRYKALVQLGYDTALCVVASGLDDEQKRKYRLLDNKLGEIARWDYDALDLELDGLDFGQLSLDWNIPEMQLGESESDPIDLESPISEPPEKSDCCTLLHCPKCGFAFEVK